MPSRPEPSAWVTVAVIAQMALGLLAMTVCVPSMLDWPATFGATTAQVQLTFSAYVAPYGLLQLVHGPLSDRIGRRPVLLTGLVLCVAGATLGALATDLWTLVAARVLQGAGGAAGMVVGRAMVQDLFAGPQRTRMMAFVGMTMGVSPPVAMVVGGYLHVTLGWQANFVLMAVLTVLVATMAWRLLPEPVQGPDRPAPSPVIRSYLTLLREPRFLALIVLLASSSAAFYTYLAGAPLLYKQFGVPPERLGFYIMVIPLSYMVGNVLTTRLIGRLGERRLMQWGQFYTFLGLGLVLALAFASVRSPWAVALPLILLGVGHGLMMPPTLAATVGLIPALAGSAAALGGVTQQAVGSLGGYFVALVAHHDAINLVLQMLGWTLFGLVAQWWMFRRPAPRP